MVAQTFNPTYHLEGRGKVNLWVPGQLRLHSKRPCCKKQNYTILFIRELVIAEPSNNK